MITGRRLDSLHQQELLKELTIGTLCSDVRPSIYVCVCATVRIAKHTFTYNATGSNPQTQLISTIPFRQQCCLMKPSGGTRHTCMPDVTSCSALSVTPIKHQQAC
jgi:hypothetical protein